MQISMVSASSRQGMTIESSHVVDELMAGTDSTLEVTGFLSDGEGTSSLDQDTSGIRTFGTLPLLRTSPGMVGELSHRLIRDARKLEGSVHIVRKSPKVLWITGNNFPDLRLEMVFVMFPTTP